MKRYYLCDVIGDGLSEETAYRPAVAGQAGVQWSWDMLTDETGRPVRDFGLVVVDARDHERLQTMQGVSVLPAIPLDGKMSASATAEMRRALHRMGLNAGMIVDGAETYREVVRALGRLTNPAFHEGLTDIGGA